MEIDRFSVGDHANCLSILKAVVKNLDDRGESLWQKAELTSSMFDRYHEPLVVCGYKGSQTLATMLLCLYDPEYWPNIPKNESIFIHKLARHPDYRGQSVALEMMNYAHTFAKEKGISLSRLDCAADRPKLCGFYESLGYQKVDERIVDSYPTAFYEKTL